MVENHKVIGKGMIARIGVSRGISGGEESGQDLLIYLPVYS